MSKTGSKAGPSPWHRKAPAEVSAVFSTGGSAAWGECHAYPPAARAEASGPLSTASGRFAAATATATPPPAAAATTATPAAVAATTAAAAATAAAATTAAATGLEHFRSSKIGRASKMGRSQKRTVLVINTGGTLGMQKDETGGGLAPVPGYFTSQMLLMEDLSSSEEMPDFDIVEYEPLLDSSCFRPSDWAQIAVDIGRAYHHYDGFVVCMGTDTMAYAASALSFMLENLGKTVVFTGSQIPLAEVYNDARRNVIVAIMIAGGEDIPEVCIFFANRLLRANRAVKVDSLALTAYDSPNFPRLGNLGVSMKYRRDVLLLPPRGPFRVHTSMDSRVVVIKLIPGFADDALLVVVEHCTALRAIVLELYGTGNSPSRREEFVRFIKVAKSKGVLVVAVTQCLKGGVSLGTYAVGVALEKNGVISGGDMTTEAVVSKLAYLFGRTDDIQEVRHLMTQNLRGEMSPPGNFQQHIFGSSGKVEARHWPLEPPPEPTPPSSSGGPLSRL